MTPTLLPPTVTSTPTVAASGTPPRVEEFTEARYQLQQGDTFNALSQKYFNSPDYAKALELYNLSHNLADDQVRLGKRKLGTGDYIYIPPAYVLQKQYSVVIPRTRAASADISPVNQAVYTVSGSSAGMK